MIFLGLDHSLSGRAGGIRTHDLFVPNEALYQAEPQPEFGRQPEATVHRRSMFSIACPRRKRFVVNPARARCGHGTPRRGRIQPSLAADARLRAPLAHTFGSEGSPSDQSWFRFSSSREKSSRVFSDSGFVSVTSSGLGVSAAGLVRPSSSSSSASAVLQGL